MITVVSGLPRSGTSLMMQMLAAGGLPPLTDGLRAPDNDNPRGYCEWEPVKQLPRNPPVIAEAEGKVVKVISTLLMALPGDRQYQVIFMRRPLEEVAASQTAMIRRLGTTGAAFSPAAMLAALNAHLRQVLAWAERQSFLKLHHADYHAILDQPAREAERIAEFLGTALDVAAMAAAVVPSLRRQGAPAP